MTIVNPEIAAKIVEFVSLLQALYDDYYAKNFSNLVSPLIVADTGGVKYQRILVLNRYMVNGKVETHESGSVYCFIDLSNGDILKAAGYKAPAKGARGSIFNPNCDVGVKATMHGSGLYLR